VSARLDRILEPEVMDTEEEARDYDAMDHREVNARFCDDVLAFAKQSGRPLGRVLDIGTGTALIPIELCARKRAITVDAIDLAEHMLALARRNVEHAGLVARIALHRIDAKRTAFGDGAFGGVVSNSIVHHIPSPFEMLREALRLTTRGGVLFVRDLARPDTQRDLDALVDTYAAVPAGLEASARAMHVRQRGLFAASLHAALTVDEARAMVAPLGIPAAAVQRTSDRHFTLAHVRT
jgi:ubiquinone/menaquinone biosynthesis C-methylase UbiE